MTGGCLPTWGLRGGQGAQVRSWVPRQPHVTSIETGTSGFRATLKGHMHSWLHLQPLPGRTRPPWGWRYRHQPGELLALGGTHLERREGTLLWVHAGACAGGGGWGGTWMLQVEEWKGRKQPTMPVLRAAAAPTELVTHNCWSKTSPDTLSPLSPDVFTLSS